MFLKKLIGNYTDYNLWANTVFVEWLKTKPENILNEEIPSSFSSISKTLIHICDAERFWLSNLKSTSTLIAFEKEVLGTNEKIMLELIILSKDFSEYVSSITETELQSECFVETEWEKGKLPKYEFIQHCMNHSTYHRGQIITISHNMGLVDIPKTDYNFYNIGIRRNNNDK